MNLEQTGRTSCFLSILHIYIDFNEILIGVASRPNRPSPNAAPVEIVTTNESQTTLSDAHYDRLEAILIEKIQTYIQGGMRNS